MPRSRAIARVTCVSVRTKRCVRATTSSLLPRPSSITAPVSSSTCQLPRAVSASSSMARSSGSNSGLAPGTCAAPGRLVVRAGQPRQVVLLDVGQLASNTSPKLLTSPSRPRRPSAPPACAPAACTAQPVRELAPHHRLAHPGHRLEGCARARQVDGEEVARQPRRHVGAQRDRVVVRHSPCTLMPAQRKAGWRSTHQPPPPAAASANSREHAAVAGMFISLTSKGDGDAVGHRSPRCGSRVSGSSVAEPALAGTGPRS